jgi:predicted transcriptional regulator
MVEELSEKEKRIVSLLVEIGLSRNIAKIVVLLSRVGEAVSRDIERAANLRQPEVSLAMKDLRAWGWIKEKELKRRGKGRPLKSYKLTIDLRDIVAELVDKRRKEVEKTIKHLNELEELVGLKT